MLHIISHGAVIGKRPICCEGDDYVNEKSRFCDSLNMYCTSGGRENIIFQFFLVTSEIWPQPNVVSFHQSVHCFFYQRHIARIFDILDAGEGGGRKRRWCNAEWLINNHTPGTLLTEAVQDMRDKRGAKKTCERSLPLSPDRSH